MITSFVTYGFPPLYRRKNQNPIFSHHPHLQLSKPTTIPIDNTPKQTPKGERKHRLCGTMLTWCFQDLDGFGVLGFSVLGVKGF